MNSSNYLLFILTDRIFGVRLSGAKEIFPWRRPRPVPLSYSYVEGLIDYRGTVYPVYNIEQRMRIKRTGPIGFAAAEQFPHATAKNRSIILLEEKNVPFAIIVDGVLKMAIIEEQTDKPKKVEWMDTVYLKWVARVDEQDVMILDLERMIHAG